MHPYVPHLLEDIKNAQREEEPFDMVSDDELEEHFEEVERWLSGDEPALTFGEYCGLNTVDFPPPEQLSEEDMKILSTAFEKMMLTWNLEVSFPEKLPVAISYKMLVDLLDTKTQIVKNGFIGFDFCTGDPDQCVFKEYCSCLNYGGDAKDDSFPDTSGDDDDIPY